MRRTSQLKTVRRFATPNMNAPQKSFYAMRRLKRLVHAAPSAPNVRRHFRLQQTYQKIKLPFHYVHRNGNASMRIVLDE